MNRKTRRTYLMILVLMSALFVQMDNIVATGQSIQPAQAEDHLVWAYTGGIEQYKGEEFVPGEILVGYHRDRVAAAGLQSSLGMQAIETLDLRGLDGETGDAGVSGYRMAVSAGAEWETIEQLLDDPAIAFATPNWVVRAAGTTVLQQDGNASIETAFEVDDTFYAGRQWYQQRINASRAWQLALDYHDADNPPIRVAVIDSGIYTDHIELTPYVLPGVNYIKPGLPPVDDFGHGTHIAGIIGATLNNNRGVAGVAPWIEIDPYKILDKNGSGDIADLAKAIQDATDNDANIINLSIETKFDSPTVAAAVQRAAVSNALLIGSAGNWGKSFGVAYPAALDDVVAVAATTYDDDHARYSAQGEAIELAAPGGEQTSLAEQIFSTWSRHPDATCYTDLERENEDTYCYAAGTSMSGAVVSGVAALIWGLDPSMPSEAVRATLARTATPLPLSSDEIGSGRVDAHAAVRSLIPTELQPSVEQLSLRSKADAEPFIATVALTNPSLAPLDWRAELENDEPWIRLAGFSPSIESGTIRYGEPAYVSMILSPAELNGGLGINTLILNGDVEKGSAMTPLQVILDASSYRLHFPRIPNQVAVSNRALATQVPFGWIMPEPSEDREKLIMLDTSSVEIKLPFAFPMGEKSYRYVHVHSDGLITLPGDDLVPLLGNRCLPSSDWPQNAIFGWWADLDPSQAGAQISHFNVGADRYVVEFFNVPTAASVTPAYTVSFQIVLDNDGDVRLHYLDLPDAYDRPPQATVGVESVDGRFHNRVYCNDGENTLGQTPYPGQTLLFRPKDIY